MPAKIITFHSYKGGTGKSFLSLNTAAYLAYKLGNDVAVLDFDFRAPTLIHKFPTGEKVRFLNEYLEGGRVLLDFLYNRSTEIWGDQPPQSTFSVAYASSRSSDMQEMQMKTRQWQQRALGLLMRGLQTIRNAYDWVIIDSSPGVTYDSLNAMSSSDAVVLVATPDRVDIQGTLEMSGDIYPSLVKFGAQPALVLNKIPWLGVSGESGSKLYPTEGEEERFREEVDIPVISRCPCYCDSSLIENTLLVTECEDHPLLDNVRDVVHYFQTLRGR